MLLCLYFFPNVVSNIYIVAELSVCPLVFDILSKWMILRDWKEAVRLAIPSRKLLEPKSEIADVSRNNGNSSNGTDFTNTIDKPN